MSYRSGRGGDSNSQPTDCDDARTRGPSGIVQVDARDTPDHVHGETVADYRSVIFQNDGRVELTVVHARRGQHLAEPGDHRAVTRTEVVGIVIVMPLGDDLQNVGNGA